MIGSKGAVSYQDAVAMPIGEAMALLVTINEMHQAADDIAKERAAAGRDE